MGLRSPRMLGFSPIVKHGFQKITPLHGSSPVRIIVTLTSPLGLPELAVNLGELKDETTMVGVAPVIEFKRPPPQAVGT